MKDYNYSEISSKYDDEVSEYNSYGHEVIFGMCYDFVKSGENLLDLGIGTGLASQKFEKLGLNIYGLDISESMLKICESKKIAKELKIHTLEEKLPYENKLFNHVISCGVFHFFDDLSIIFSEVSRIIMKNGIFAFTFMPNKFTENFSKEMTEWNVELFRHSSDYINNLLTENEFKILKEQRLLMKGADKKTFNMEFSVIVAKKMPSKNDGIN